jgi:hypothetical protein
MKTTGFLTRVPKGESSLFRLEVSNQQEVLEKQEKVRI